MFSKPLIKRLWWVLPIVALLILIPVLSSQYVHLLLVDDVRHERLVFAERITPGDLLSIGFLHSVEHCYIWDRLQVDEGYGLVVVATEFAESRTGLPYAAFEGEVFERLENGFRISNMRRPVPEIYQWVDTKYDNKMTINNHHAISLTSLAGNTLLHIRTDKLTLLEWLLLEAKLSKLFRRS